MSRRDSYRSFHLSCSKSHPEAHLSCIASYPTSNTYLRLQSGWHLLGMHLFGFCNRESYYFYMCLYHQSNNGYQLQRNLVEIHQQCHRLFHPCSEACHLQFYTHCGIHHQHTNVVHVLYFGNGKGNNFNKFVI